MLVNLGKSDVLEFTSQKSQGADITLTGLDKNHIVSWFVSRLVISEVTPGGVPVTHKPIEMAQALKDYGFNLKAESGPKSGSFKYDISVEEGRDMMLYTRGKHTKNGMHDAPGSIDFLAGSTSTPWYVDVYNATVPNFVRDKALRPKLEWFEGATFKANLSTVDFDLTNDFTQIKMQLFLYALVEEVSSDYVVEPGGFRFVSGADFDNNDQININGFLPTWLALKSRTNATSYTLEGAVDGRNGKKSYYTTATPNEIDIMNVLHRPKKSGEFEPVQGDEWFQNLPVMVEGAQSTEDWLVAHDIRSNKELDAPIKLKAHSKSGQTGYIAAGWAE